MSDRDPSASLAHADFAELLAGYVDDELTPEQRQQVEAHVPECSPCQADLRAQTVIRTRLMQESLSSASSELAARVLARIDAAGQAVAAGDAPRAVSSRRQWLVTWGGWAAAAALGGVSVWLARKPAAMGGMTMQPTGPVSLDQVPDGMSVTILDSFREVNESELPVGTSLDLLRKELPFSVPALEAPHMRLISAWVTRVHGEPAAALAYRCHDRLVVQYVVSEQQFFRQPGVRHAIATQGVYAAAAGPLTTIAWPGTDSGSFLVGEFTASDLVAMRT